MIARVVERNRRKDRIVKTKKEAEVFGRKWIKTLPDCFKAVAWHSGEWNVSWVFGDFGIGYVEKNKIPFYAYYHRSSSAISHSIIAKGESPVDALNAAFGVIASELQERTAEIELVGSFFKELERQCKLKSVTAKCRSQSAKRRTN